MDGYIFAAPLVSKMTYSVNFVLCLETFCSSVGTIKCGCRWHNQLQSPTTMILRRLTNMFSVAIVQLHASFFTKSSWQATDASRGKNFFCQIRENLPVMEVMFCRFGLRHMLVRAMRRRTTVGMSVPHSHFPTPIPPHHASKRIRPPHGKHCGIARVLLRLSPWGAQRCQIQHELWTQLLLTRAR